MSNVTQFGTNGNRITIVDPNPPNSEIIPTENLFIYASLRIRPKGRSVIQTSNNGTTTDSERGLTINFIGTQVDENGNEYMTTDWTNIGGTFKSTPNNQNKETFGITNISISYGADLLPKVNISFIDMKGASLFDGFERKDKNGVLSNVSNYSSFFTYPYPIFELTIKGYYGKAVTYCLNMIKWSSSFREGNFEINAEFMGFSNSFLSDIIIDNVRAVMNTDVGIESLNKVYQKNSKGKEPKTIDEFLTDIGNVQKYTENFKFPLNPSGNDDTGYQTLITLNTSLDKLSKIKDKVGTTLVNNKDTTTPSYYSLEGSYIKFKGLKERFNIFAFRDIMMVDQTAISTYNEFIEDLKQEIINYDNSLPKVGFEDFSKSYSILMFSTISTDTLLPKQTTPLTSGNTAYDAADNIDNILRFNGYLREKDDGYINSDVDILSFTGFTGNKGFGYNNLVGYFDFYPLRNIVNSIYDTLYKKRKEFADTVTKKINDKITKSLNFNPSIGNIFEIFCNNVEAYLDVIYNTSITAEKLNESRVSLLKNSKTDVNTKKENPRIYPWPMLYDDKGNEQYLGKNEKVSQEPTSFPEIQFIEDLAASIAKQKIVKNSKELLVSVGRGFPINPSDVVDGTNDYVIENFNNANRRKLIDSILKRALLSYDFSNYKKQFIDISKFEASSLHTNIINDNDIKAINSYLSMGYENFINEAINVGIVQRSGDKILYGKPGMNLNSVYEEVNSFVTNSNTIFFTTEKTNRSVSEPLFGELKTPIQLNEKTKKYVSQVDLTKSFVGNLPDATFNTTINTVFQDFTKICFEESVLDDKTINLDKLYEYIGKVKSKKSEEIYRLNNSESYTFYTGMTESSSGIKNYLKEDEYKTILILSTLPFKQIDGFVNNLSDITKIANVPLCYLAWLGSLLLRQNIYKNFKIEDKYDLFYYFLTDGVKNNESINEFKGSQLDNVYQYFSIESNTSKFNKNLPIPFNNIENFNQKIYNVLIFCFNEVVNLYRNSGLLEFFNSKFDEKNLKNILKKSDFIETITPINFVSYTPNFWNLKEEQFFSIKELDLNQYFTVFSQTFNELTNKDLQNKTKESFIQKVVTDNDIKLSLYKTHKNLYDKWVGGTIDGKPFNSCGGFNTNSDYSLFKYFRFINKDYSDISNIARINLNSLSILSNNSNVSFLELIARVLEGNNFLFLTLPVFVDYSKIEEIKSIFDTSKTIEKANSGPAFVAMYDSGNSKNLDLGNASDYENDGYDYIENDPSSLPNSLTDNRDETNNSLVVFRVAFGDENQSIFKNISISQDEFTDTDASYRALSDLVDSNGATQRSFKGTNFYNVYSLRSYTLNFEMMGNAMIQPLMYLQLDNIPMFHGAYSVSSISHEITPNKMSTKIKAVRKSKYSVPIVDQSTTFIPVDLNKTLEEKVVKKSTNSRSPINNVNVESKTIQDFKSPVPLQSISKFGRSVSSNHDGIDLAVNVGTPLSPSWSGTIYEYVQNKANETSGGRAGYGLFAVIDHSNGTDKPFDDGYFYYTLYAHLSSLTVKTGKQVNVGQVFGKSGGQPGEKNSGNSRGAHLHFEIRRTKTKLTTDANQLFVQYKNVKDILDPLIFLKKNEYVSLSILETDDQDFHSLLTDNGNINLA